MGAGRGDPASRPFAPRCLRGWLVLRARHRLAPTGDDCERWRPVAQDRDLQGILPCGWFACVLGMLALLVAGAASAQERVEWIAPVALAPAQEPAIVHVIAPGETSFRALRALGLNAQAIHALAAAARKVKLDLRRVAPGDWFEKKADALIFHPRRHPPVRFARKKGVWRAEPLPEALSERIAVYAGEIRDSLFLAGERAGLDDRTIMNLADIFAWEVDFHHDLRPGDRFRVVLRERYDARGTLVEETILAARLILHGRTITALRFEVAPGRAEYFTPEGKNLRRSYLRAPLRYTRISSRFTLHRKHPILGYTRAHRGVDYAAPIGTPVRAVGDGIVTFAGWRGGYGRLVEIRHTNRIHRTRYAHLSRFARGIRPGRHVRQGQVIGYVGKSGLATGPHLHFEFLVRGRRVNPLTIPRPRARSVPKGLLARFRAATAPMLALLNQPVRVAAWE